MQLPDPVREGIEGMELEIQLHQIVERRVCFGRHNMLGRFESTQDAGCLHAGEFWSMQRAYGKHFFGPCAV